MLGQSYPSFGHSLGLAWENPSIVPGEAAVLEPRMVMAVEAQVGRPGAGTGAFEHNVLVTEDGVEVLTAARQERLVGLSAGRAARRRREAVAAARERGAELICLPHLSFSPYVAAVRDRAGLEHAERPLSRSFRTRSRRPAARGWRHRRTSPRARASSTSPRGWRAAAAVAPRYRQRRVEAAPAATSRCSGRRATTRSRSRSCRRPHRAAGRLRPARPRRVGRGGASRGARVVLGGASEPPSSGRDAARGGRHGGGVRHDRAGRQPRRERAPSTRSGAELAARPTTHCSSYERARQRPPRLLRARGAADRRRAAPAPGAPRHRRAPGEHPPAPGRRRAAARLAPSGTTCSCSTRATPASRTRCARTTRLRRGAAGGGRRRAGLARHRHAHRARELRPLPARHRRRAQRGRRRRDGGLPPPRQPVHADAAARPPHRARPGDGVLPAQPRLDRRALRAGDLRVRARRDPRLGRPPRQRHAGHPLGGPVGAVRLAAPVAAVPRHRLARRGRRGRRDGAHRQPAAAPGLGRPRAPRGARPGRAADHRGVRPAAADRLRRPGRPRRRHAVGAAGLGRRVPRDGRARGRARQAARDRARARARGRLQRQHPAGARPRDPRRASAGSTSSVDDLFVPEDAPVPDGWDERLREILEVQRRHWPELR